MPDFVYVLVGGLVVYRVALLITREEGPADIFKKIREFCDLRFGVNSSLAKGISCPLCVSFWVSWPVAWPYSTGAINFIFSALAIATIAALLFKFFRTV